MYVTKHQWYLLEATQQHIWHLVSNGNDEGKSLIVKFGQGHM